MAGSRQGWWRAGIICVACAMTIAIVQGAPPATDASKGASPVKMLLADEANGLEREIAARMMRRGSMPADKRAKLETEIDLRIIERALVAMAADARFPSNEQAALWLRAKQFREALRGMEDAMAQDPSAGLTASQKEAVGQIHKLSYVIADAKGAKELDDFCRAAAVSMASAVSPNPVTAAAMAAMRPKPLAGSEPKDQPASVTELSEQVQKLAAISVPLRQQLLALSSAASSATEKEEAKTLYALLSQSIELARGLQSNTAVGPESRTSIESQLAEGIVLFADPRTRDAGRNRVESLGQYRQTLARIGRMGLTKEQMDQLAPALTWAQVNPESGAKLMVSIEQYMETCAKWDAMLRDVSVPAPLRRPLDDLKSQFGKQRSAFLQSASHVGVVTPGDLEQAMEEIKRLFSVTEDVQAMGASMDVLNAYKVKPIGGLEKKVATAAIAAASPTPSTNRNDGQRYLDAVHALADLSRGLAARPLTDLSPAVAQGWAGGKLDGFELRWKGIVADLIGTLIGGAMELDKGKVIRLEGAMSMGDSVRTVAQLDAALPKMPALARWVDWSIDPGSLQIVLTPYKEAMAGAFAGYVNDNLDAVDKWGHLRGRYTPLITLILRDAGYAEQCEAMPIGFPAEVARLAAPFDGAPFGTERYASYAIGVWSASERGGDVETADRISIDLAKHLARDLRVPGNIDESSLRSGKRPRN
jgi:hypothetical protein